MQADAESGSDYPCGAIGTDARSLQGRAQAFTMVTPIKRGWTPWLRFNFFFGRHVPYVTKKLRELSFIHYARWSIVKRIPGRNYLLVTSNFNGTWEEYIEAFSEIVPWRIRAIWGSSIGFPGPSPAERLKDYVRRTELPSEHYYSAYPDASTTLVLSALELRARFDRFVRNLPEGAGSEDFRQAWHAFLTDVQGHL